MDKPVIGRVTARVATDAIGWADRAVVVRGGGRVRVNVDWSLDAAWNQRLNDFDLWLVWAGRGQMMLHDREVTLRPGVCLWMRPRGFYRATSDPVQRLGVTFIHFDLIDQRGRVDLDPPGLPGEVAFMPDLQYADAVGRRIIDLMPTLRPDAAVQPAARLEAQTLLRGLLMTYHNAHRTTADNPAAGATDHAATLAEPARTTHQRQTVLAAASRIDDDPTRDWTVQELARHAGYSRDHFSRIFRQTLDQSPRDYLIQARVSLAAQLLTESSLTISQVAYAAGYEDVYYFSRQFRQKMGCPPSVYRRDAAGRY